MVKVKIYTDADGRIYRFAAEGHSGFAPHGEDIVCAAVSVLLQTAVLGLEKVACIRPEVAIDDGYLICHLSREQTSNTAVSVILKTMLLGLQAIQGEYGNYVSVKRIDSKARSAPSRQ